MLFSPIQCANPTIVRRHDILDYISTFDYDVYLNGELQGYDINYAIMANVAYILSPRRLSVDVSNYCSFFIENRYTGKRILIFQVFPCGHCALCRADKREQWSFRCECETACHPTMPVMLTLTYDEDNVPLTPSGVRTLCKEDVQQFFHKLRDTLRYRYGYDKPIRYICVGEYGSPQYTERPHYHIIMWNFPTAEDFGIVYSDAMCRLKRDEIYIKFVYKFLTEKRSYHTSKDSEGIWPKCSIIDFDYCGVKCNRDPRTGRVLFATRSYDKAGAAAGCAKYVSKYVTKGTHVPVGAAPGFMLTSRRKGGIGRPYLDLTADQYQSFNDYRLLKVLNPFSRQLTKCVMPLAFRNYLFPSVSRILPYGFRKGLKNLHTYANLLVQLSAAVSDHLRKSTISCKFMQDDFDKYTLFPILKDFDWAVSHYDKLQIPDSLVGCALFSESRKELGREHYVAAITSAFYSTSDYDYLGNSVVLSKILVMFRRYAPMYSRTCPPVVLLDMDSELATAFRRDLYYTCQTIVSVLLSVYKLDDPEKYKDFLTKAKEKYYLTESYKAFVNEKVTSRDWYDVENLNYVQEYYDNLNNMKRTL